MALTSSGCFANCREGAELIRDIEANSNADADEGMDGAMLTNPDAGSGTNISRPRMLMALTDLVRNPWATGGVVMLLEGLNGVCML
jgi:hypothetical protein